MNKKYLRLPYNVQKLLVNVYGLSVRRSRFTSDFRFWLKKYLEEDFTEIQKLDLEKVIDVAKESPFYSIKTERDFFNSPVVDKQIVKENYERIINNKHVFQYYHTSGTTGSGLNYPVSKEFLHSQWAVYWKFRYIHGLTTKTWCAYLIGKNILNADRKNPPYWMKSYPTRQYLFSVNHLNTETVRLYLEKIKESGLYWMHGYPSTLNYLASLIIECGLEDLARDLKLSIITTSSETLYDFQKCNIEKIFGCKVRQLYGMTEGVASIFECEEGMLHVDETFSYVEFIKDPQSGDHHIVGTSYFNYAFPLIRYNTGDTVKLYDTEVKCRCGRNSRVVKEIVGREQDYLILDNGTKVGGSGFFFKKAQHVKRAQIHQKNIGEATFYIVRGEGYCHEEEEHIIEEIQNKLGHDFRYKIEYIDELIKMENGKTRFVINEIDNQLMNPIPCNLNGNEVNYTFDGNEIMNDSHLTGSIDTLYNGR